MAKLVRIFVALGVLAAASVPAQADEPVASISGNRISVGDTAGLTKVTLSIVGPGGFHVQEYSEAGSPSIALGGLSALPEGIYTYEITGATNELEPVNHGLDNGRGDTARTMMSKGAWSSGSFKVSGGSIVEKDNATE